MRYNPVVANDGLVPLGIMWSREADGGWSRTLFRQFRRNRQHLWTPLLWVDASKPWCPMCFGGDVEGDDTGMWCMSCEKRWRWLPDAAPGQADGQE